MLVSEREASGLLAGAGLTREPARRLLKAGFAGVPLRTRGALLYDRDQVAALVEPGTVPHAEFTRSCPSGAFVLRTWRGVDVAAPPEEQLARLRLTWWLSPWAYLLIAFGIRHRGHFPMLVTVSGFVAHAAEIVELAHDAGDRDTRLVVRPAGEWSTSLAGRQVLPHTGGPWVLWRTRRLQQ